VFVKPAALLWLDKLATVLHFVLSKELSSFQFYQGILNRYMFLKILLL